MIRALGIAPLLLANASAQELPESYRGRFQLAYESFEEGRFDEAATLYESCLELSPRNPTTAYHLAAVHARAGRVDAALTWIELAVAWGYADAAVIAWDEDLAVLRGDSRFFVAVWRAAAIAVEPDDGTIRWWLPDADSALVTPDGTRAVVTAFGDTVLWDPVEEDLVAVLGTPTGHARAALGPDARTVITLGSGESYDRPWIQAWDVASGALLWDVTLPRVPWSGGTGIRFTPDRSHVVMGQAWTWYWVSRTDGEVTRRRSRAPELAPVEDAVGHRRSIHFSDGHFQRSSCATAIDDTRIAVATGVGEIILVDIDSALPLSRYRTGVGRIDAITSHGSLLVVDGRGSIAFLDVDGGGDEWQVAGGRSWTSEDGDRVLVDVGNSARVHHMRHPLSVKELPVDGRITSVAWSPDADRVAIATGDRVRLWDVATGESRQHSFDHQGTVYALSFIGDGQRLATGCFNTSGDLRRPRLHVWDVETGQQVAGVSELGLFGVADVETIRYDAENEQLLCVMGSIPDIEARHPETLELIWSSYESGSGPTRVRLEQTPSGRLFAAAEGQARVVDVTDGSLVRAFGHEVTDIAPSTDGRRAFAIRHGALDILDGDTLERLVTRVEFPDDGELVFVPSLYFSGTSDALERAWILIDGIAAPLADWVERLYDPKRVAAGAAGVRVRPPSLR